MGMIHDILKHTVTKKLPKPMVRINFDLIKTRSDKEHLKTIQAIEKKKADKLPVTNKDRREFRVAVNALERRGSAKILHSIEVDKK